MTTTLSVTNHNWSGLAGDSAWLIYDNRMQSALHLDGYSVCPRALTLQHLAAHFGLGESTKPSAFREEPEGYREVGIITALTPGTPAASHTARQSSEAYGSNGFWQRQSIAPPTAASFQAIPPAPC